MEVSTVVSLEDNWIQMIMNLSILSIILRTWCVFFITLDLIIGNL